MQTVERRFLLRLPANYDGKTPHPVVLAFHGFTQGAQGMEAMVDFAAEWPEAIVVYPEGLERTLPRFVPGSGKGWQLVAGELGDRDLAFFDALRRWIFANACADESRLYVVGYSNGAYFAHLLGCTRPEAIAAIAAGAGAILCRPTRPVPVILSHGAEDSIVPFDRGVEADRAWRARNGCAAEAETPRSGCRTTSGCAADVVFCAHPGGHPYDPGFTQRAAEFFRQRR